METEVEQPITTNGDGPDDDPEAAVEHSPAEVRDPQHLFQFSRFVHVGPGAVNCEEGEDGSCANPLHFHAWIRLPNQFQHSSIREKALAAKARKMRQLRNEDSDERAIIDGDLDDLVRAGDKEVFIEEIVNKDFLTVHIRAMREVTDDEDSDFKTIEEDRERLRALQATPEDERPEEEFTELQAHLAKFNDAVEERRKELLAPAREAIENSTIEELCDLVREQRSAAIAQDEFNSVYSVWECYISTLKPQPQGMPAGKPQTATERVFQNIEHLKSAAPEVIEALDLAFTEIEAEAGRAMRGF